MYAIRSYYERAPERFIEAWALKGREDERLLPLLNQLQRFGVSIQWVQRKTLDDKAEGAIHQGIIARIKEGRKYDEADLFTLLDQVDTPFLLVLDGVTDPHNLGACLRSADAAGVHALIVPRDKSVSLNATARKVACGAAETVPFIQVTSYNFV